MHSEELNDENKSFCTSVNLSVPVLRIHAAGMCRVCVMSCMYLFPRIKTNPFPHSYPPRFCFFSLPMTIQFDFFVS